MSPCIACSGCWGQGRLGGGHRRTDEVGVYAHEVLRGERVAGCRHQREPAGALLGDGRQGVTRMADAQNAIGARALTGRHGHRVAGAERADRREWAAIGHPAAHQDAHPRLTGQHGVSAMSYAAGQDARRRPAENDLFEVQPGDLEEGLRVGRRRPRLMECHRQSPPVPARPSGCAAGASTACSRPLRAAALRVLHDPDRLDEVLEAVEAFTLALIPPCGHGDQLAIEAELPRP
jgi:hypothetical protein